MSKYTEKNVMCAEHNGNEKKEIQQETPIHKIEKKEVLQKKLGNTYIAIKKNYAGILPISIRDCYEEHKVEIYFYHMTQETIQKKQITFVKKDKKQNGEKMGEQLELAYTKTAHEGLQLRLSITVPQIYAYELYEDQKYIYVNCRAPKEVYSHILVLDAGHGGKDSGSNACKGKWQEKDYNLDFEKRLAETLNLPDWKIYLTRTDDERVFLKQRVHLANEVGADLFLSLHCNSSDCDEGTGLEALVSYNENKEQAKRIAKSCLTALSQETGLSNRGIHGGESIYIIRNTTMPTVLLELGFLSDPGDVDYLSQEDNREKMVEVIGKNIREMLTE